MVKKRVLIVIYSFSHQTHNLIKGFVQGLEENDVEVSWENIRTVEPLRFPIGTFFSTIKMMLLTAIRKRYAIQEISAGCFDGWDLIILAGPTWSYNPSGPILSLFDRDGKRLFGGQRVLPFISCRGYWRLHLLGLHRLLKKYGAECTDPIIFSHPTPEPWRTIGVFLKLAGKVPEAGSSWFRRFYPKYGHSRQQVDEAIDVGRSIGESISEGKTITGSKLWTPVETENK